MPSNKLFDRGLWGICLIGLLAVNLLGQPAPQPVLSYNFDNDLDKPHIRELTRHRNIDAVATQGLNNSGAIRVSYVGMEQGSERVVRNQKLPGAYLEATLNYSVMFSPDFNFVLAGKLHGLGPDNPITGGYAQSPERWSVRVVFERNALRSYIYHQNQRSRFGDSFQAPGFRFQRGIYHDIAIYVKVNDPEYAHNGIVEIFADGKSILRNDSLQLRGTVGDHTLINQFLFNTFHGGGSIRYAPRDAQGNFTTEYAWFDNIEIYEGRYVRAEAKLQPDQDQSSDFQ